MRKTEIRDRMGVLEMQLAKRKSTPAQQADERARLIEACRATGDHVFELVFTAAGIVHACMFCHASDGCASDEQRRRNLVRG